MKKVLACITSLMLAVNGALVNQTSTNEQPRGNWSGTLEGKDEFSNKSEQYVFCGYALQTQNWNTTVNNCNCGYAFWRGQIRWRCLPCVNQLDSKVSGFRATFCHYNNWNDQIVKTISSNSSNAGGWKNATMCTQNYYSTGVSPKFGMQYGQDLGMTGLQLQCSTLTLANSQLVEDGGIGRPVTMFKPTAGNFVTSLKVKLESNGVLTGLTSQFEGLPVVAKVKINYYPVVDHNSIPIAIDTFSDVNCGSFTAIRKVTFSKTHETTSIWRSNEGYTKGLSMNKIVVDPPTLPSNSSEGGNHYKANTQQFGLDKIVKTTLSSGQQLTVSLAAMKQTKIDVMIQEQKGSLPYTATITVVNLYTGQFIMEYTVEGTWEGVMVSSARTLITETPAKCPDPIGPPPPPPNPPKPNPPKPNPPKPNPPKPTPKKNLKEDGV